MVLPGKFTGRRRNSGRKFMGIHSKFSEIHIKFTVIHCKFTANPRKLLVGADKFVLDIYPSVRSWSGEHTTGH